MPTIVLILPTGTYRAEEYLAAARRLGVTVVTASEHRQALAGTMGERFLEIPLDDPESAADLIVERGRRLGISAVVAVDDEGLLTAALASEGLGLAHSSSAAVRLTRDKAAMRAAFTAAGVSQPGYLVVAPGSAAGVAAAADTLGTPVVVKPCSLSGSRGVIRADSPAEAGACAERIAAILAAAREPADSPLLVERFVPGPEVAVEGIVTGGELDIITIFDKPDPLDGPYFEETRYVAPTDLDELAREAVAVATREAVQALGLTEGPVHVELRVPPRSEEKDAHQDVFVLEVAARTIGGRCSKALALPGGASLEDLVVARAAGLPAPEPRLAGPGGVLMIPIPRSGTLRSVLHVDEVRELAHISGVEITVPPGRRIAALPEGDRYVGFVFAAGPSRRDVEDALGRAMEMIEVDVDSDPASAPDTVVG